MIKILANKCLAFERGEKDKYGALKYVKVHVGFNEIPDWVEQTDFYQAAVKDKSIQVVSAHKDEDALKLQEKHKAYEDKIRALEEENEKLKNKKHAGRPPKVSE